MSTDSYLHMKKHLKPLQADEAIQDHFFEQLHMDLERAMEEAKTLMEHDRLHPYRAAREGIRRMAGRRFSRYKDAENSGDKTTEEEMKSFAEFWHTLSNKMGELIGEE